MLNQGRKSKMAGSTKGLKEYAKRKSQITLEKVDNAIRELALGQQKINFNSVSNLSGVSKTYLYNCKDIKKRIEDLRNKQINHIINQRAKYDKTTKSKDIIIMEKIKRLKNLNLRIRNSKNN